jgi:hypothetical protein
MGPSMRQVESGGIELTWDPAARLCVMRQPEVRATGPHAEHLVAALTGWIGASGEPFALLVDVDRGAAVDAGWRSAWSGVFRQHRDHSFIAIFKMGPLVRIAAEMFRVATGVRLKTFADERSARLWLREMGIPA